MKLLIELKQTNNQNKYTLEPLSKIDFVKEIHIVRDYPGHYLPKVFFHCIPKINPKRKVARALLKLLYMLYYGIKVKPDVIIGFDVYPHTINAFLCGAILRKPVISSIRGEVESSIRPKNKLIVGLIFCIWKKCRYVLVTGSKVKEYLINKGLDKNKVVVLPNSIDTARFYPKRLKKKYDIISIGRISREKRLDIMLKIVHEIKKINKNIKVGIVGEGPEENKLKELCSELNLNKNVEFLGLKNNTEDYFNQARIYILTSETEGLPQAMLEAMACGLPVVAPDIGDIKDVAKNNYNSIIIDSYPDIEGFKNSIIKLLKDKRLYNQFSKNAVKIKEKFSYDSAINVWNNILLK